MADEVTFNHIPAAIQAIHDGLALAIREATKKVSEDAAGWAPVDTGFLRESNYYVTSDQSTYSHAIGGAQGIDAFREVLPEVDPPPDDVTGIAAVAASYAVFVEEGTSRAGAQPFLMPAAEAMRGNLADIVAKHVNKAIERATK